MSARWQADLVLRGGRVFTGAGWARALAVRAGRVLLAGGEEQVAPLVGRGTRVVELAGRLLTPGLHDAHTHLLGGALTEEQLDLSGVRSSEELAARVAARIADRGPEGWVLGRGWDADELPGGGWPARADLDRVSPRTPALLRRRDGHAALANSEALRRAGLGPGTPDPPGGRLLRLPTGELSGILLEDPALELVSRLLPPATSAEKEHAAERLCSRAASLGITSLEDDPSFDASLQAERVYGALWGRGRLPVRVRIWRKLGRPEDELRAEDEVLAGSGVPAGRVAFGLMKGYLDGSLGSRTALLEAPYADAPELGGGVPVTEPDQLLAWALQAHRAGRQVGLHAIGDRAVRLALDVYEAIGAAEGAPSLRAARHRVEHAQMFRPEDVARLARLGVVASVQPIHLASDMRVAAPRLGAERCRTSYCWRALLRAGAALAFGTDYPVEPLDPWPGIATALTRRSPREPGLPAFEPDQALRLEEALAAATRGAAFAAHGEHRLGALVPGALADLAVFSPDPDGAADAAALAAVRCELTAVEGQVVFER